MPGAFRPSPVRLTTFGFVRPADIVGKEMQGAGFNCRVIGLVKDYHQESLEHTFDPIVFYPEQEIGFQNFSLKINTGNLAALMSFVEKTWKRH